MTGFVLFFRDENLAQEWMGFLRILSERDTQKKVDLRIFNLTGLLAPLNLQYNRYLFTFQFIREKTILEEKTRKRNLLGGNCSILEESSM